jgi:hypothetical protein
LPACFYLQNGLVANAAGKQKQMVDNLKVAWADF